MTADDILRSFEFYRLATPERRAEYAAAVRAVALPEGATFYREGDMCPHIALAGLTEVMLLTVEISVSRMDARLASLLLRLVDLHRTRTIRLTHDELAAELGTAREVVSRLLKEFERAGALRLARGQVTVVDPSRLADVAASASTL